MIKAEFRAQSLECHPDRNPDAAERFKRLHEAYATLSDPKERGLYDKWRAAQIGVPFKEWRSRFSEEPPVTHWGKQEGPLTIEDQSQSSTSKSPSTRQLFRDYKL